MDDVLNDAWALRLQQPIRAAEAVATHPAIHRAGVIQAHADWWAGESQRAVSRLDAVEPELRGARDMLWLARAIGIRGSLLPMTGDAAAALACFQEQASVARQIGDVEMHGLAYSGIGMVRMVWDTPQRAMRSFARSCELFRQGGPGFEAGLGLALLNLSAAHRALGAHDRADELLTQAESLILQAQAWSYWSEVAAAWALRLAQQGHLPLARALIETAQTMGLSDGLWGSARFRQAKIEALYGQADLARRQLANLDLWMQGRQHLKEDYLETRAVAESRSGDFLAAHDTLRELIVALRGVHAYERSDHFQQQDRQPNRARSAALERLSLEDPLTGLSNRRDFQHRAAAVLERGGALLLALIDVDNFKQVNDRFGHAVGDAVLISTASLIKQHAHKLDMVARLGGDEFLLMRESENVEALLSDMQTLCQASSSQVIEQDFTRWVVTLSIGVARVQGNLTLALGQADQALYQVKRHGKNNIRLVQTD